MLCTVTLQSYSGLNLNALASNHLEVISLYQPELSKTFKTSLEKSQKSNIDLDAIVTLEDVKKVCSVDIAEYSDASIEQSVRVIQYLILLSLYQKTFKSYIGLAETFLNDLLIAKKYWMHEDFYMKQSFFGKNIIYNFYTSEYQDKITAKIAALHQIEDDVAGILGFCLYGLSNIEKITNEDDIIKNLIMMVDSFSILFNVPECNPHQKKDPFVLYNHLLCIHEKLKKHMYFSKTNMQQNDKSSFLVEHWFGVSCATVALLTAAVLYAKNKQEVQSLYTQGKTVVPNFLHEYILNPLVGLKEVVWDGKTKKLEHVEHFPDISMPDMIKLKPFPKLSDIPQSSDMPQYTGYVDSMLNPAIKMVNDTKKDLIITANAWKDDIVTAATERQNDIQTYCNIGMNEFVSIINKWKDASEKTLNKKIDEANDTIIKNNQINIYLATLGPVLFGTYWICSSANKAYDHHVRHKNWYLPMKHIIRSIDQVINKVARSSSGNNFIDDGKLYMLIQHLKGYISCLTSEELFLMYNDIEELLSFDLNYGQKKGIIDRMYKTYEFLK